MTIILRKNLLLYRFYLVLVCFVSSSTATTDREITSYDLGPETSSIVAVHVHTLDRRPINTTLTASGHERNIIITLEISNREFILDMHINRFLFAKSYIEKIIGQDNEEKIQTDHTRDHCYYTGKVRNFDNSSAAVSTCNGIDGYFVVDNLNYHIESISKSLAAKHKVFTTSPDFGSFKCGQDTSTYQRPFNNDSNVKKMKRSFLWPQDLDRKTKVVELYIVNDLSQFKAQSSDTGMVTRRAKAIVNIVSSFYQTRDVYIVLVGMEVWTSTNKFTVSSDSSATLANFLIYKGYSITVPNDNAQLITAMSFNSNILGVASVQTMCQYGTSGGINRDITAYPPNVVASTMAHEMGHNFGQIHDTDSCTCTDKTGRCIMYPSDNTMNPSSAWSQCSIDQFNYLFQHGMDYCLYNMPPTVLDSSAVCGDGLIESGEQCDCGKAPSSECSPTCCNATTCQLIGGAQCAAGRCCDIPQCKIKDSNAVCRAVQDISCDLAEYCDGTSAYCPPDTYKQDGVNCTTANVMAYCYEGKCNNHQSQCSLLWGSGAVSGNELCYTSQNIHGNSYGNCGFVNGQNITYIPCNTNDVMCGQLQCDSSITLNYFTDYYLIGTVTISIYTCRTVIFLQANDPGLVPNGAACGSGKMCVSQKCVDVSSIYQDTCSSHCAPHQVCNNRGICQCEDGFGPPGCSNSFSAFSVLTALTTPSVPPALTTPSVPPAAVPAAPNAAHFNVSSSRTGLIVGLCILFLIILPLIILVSICSYKYRKEIRTKCQNLFANCHIEKTRPTQNIFSVNSHNQPSVTGHQQANGQGLTPFRVAPQPPKKKPLPARPERPVSTRANMNSNGLASVIPRSRNIPVPPEKPTKRIAGYDNMGYTCLQPPDSRYTPAAGYTVKHDRNHPAGGSNVKELVAQRRKQNVITLYGDSNEPVIPSKPVPLPKPQLVGSDSFV